MLVRRISSMLSRRGSVVTVGTIERGVRGVGLGYGCNIFSSPGLAYSRVGYVCSRVVYAIKAEFRSMVFSLSRGIPSVTLTCNKGGKGKVVASLKLNSCIVTVRDVSRSALRRGFGLLMRRCGRCGLLLGSRGDGVRGVERRVIEGVCG